jgi:hypothetical protein
VRRAKGVMMKQQGVTDPNPDVILFPLANPVCSRAKGVMMKQQGVTDPKPDTTPPTRSPLRAVVVRCEDEATGCDRSKT